MKLTGKCLENFEVFALEYFRKTREDYNIFTDSQVLGKFKRMSKIFQDALIVEFFDTQKIFINIKSKFGCKKRRERFSYNLFSFNSGFMWDSRQEALNEAIINANNFYNKNR